MREDENAIDAVDAEELEEAQLDQVSGGITAVPTARDTTVSKPSRVPTSFRPEVDDEVIVG